MTADEAKWLGVAASKGGVTQNDLMRLAVHRLRKELGAAGRIKPEAVAAAARASRYKLTPPRAPAGVAPAARTTGKASSNGRSAVREASRRGRGRTR